MAFVSLVTKPSCFTLFPHETLDQIPCLGRFAFRGLHRGQLVAEERGPSSLNCSSSVGPRPIGAKADDQTIQLSSDEEQSRARNCEANVARGAARSPLFIPKSGSSTPRHQ